MISQDSETTSQALRQAVEESRAWPFVEARRLLARGEKTASSGPITLETGYGPSGLPHIGTFGEAVRTQMVRRAFAMLSDRPTRMVCFSDDMDALRKVPENIPNPHRLEAAIGMPLTKVPDPFGEEESFGAANNARLRRFLDSFGFDYEFMSATQTYRSGLFDATLQRMLERYDAVREVVAPTLGPERRAVYSPFMPICPQTGRVLTAEVVERMPSRSEIVYLHPESGERCISSVLGGACKMQWKADWALRWIALGVDYEMAGKDLAPSVKLSSAVCRALGAEPPETMIYELFLDDEGRKISKSLGNGLTVETWLSYAPAESLALFMYRSPRRAKRLHFDVILRETDAYLDLLSSYEGQTLAERLDNPVRHIHGGAPPAETTPIRFDMLLNLAAAGDVGDGDRLRRFIERYKPGLDWAAHPILDGLIAKAVRYYQDVVRPTKRLRPPDDKEAEALRALDRALAACPEAPTPEALQDLCYDVGRDRFDRTGLWFKTLYRVLLGRETGPRFGSFICFYGVEETRELIAAALRRAEE